MTKKIFLVLIIALVVTMLIVPSSAVKPTVKPTATTTPDPDADLWAAIDRLEGRTTDAELQIVQLKATVATLEEENAALKERVAALEAGNCIPSSEVCDGKDNDCDGNVDEDVCEGISCYAIATCWADCQSTGQLDEECVNGCLIKGTPTAQELFSDLTQCINQECGGLPFSPGCLDDYCLDQSAACQADGGDCTDNDSDGYTTCAGDCDDSNTAVNPDASEVCDRTDNNCDGVINGPLADAACDAIEKGMMCNSEGSCSPAPSDCGNGTCDLGETPTSCPDDCGSLECYDNDSDGYTTCQNDCDDTNAAVNPDALEVCDGIDNDCDPNTVDGSADPQIGRSCDGEDSDLCMDGVNFCSAAGSISCSDPTVDTLEVCNNSDDDCDGSTDEGPLCPGTEICVSGQCTSSP